MIVADVQLSPKAYDLHNAGLLGLHRFSSKTVSTGSRVLYVREVILSSLSQW
jgi:hypothetical protein